MAKELCEKCVRPRNCEALVVPKIKKELWNTSAFKKTTKDVDKCFQTAQRYMSQGLIPLVSLMDKLLETYQAEEFRLAKEVFPVTCLCPQGYFKHQNATALRSGLRQI